MKNKKRMKKLLSLTVVGIMALTTLSGGASAQTINDNADASNTAVSVFDFKDIVTLEALDVEYNFEDGITLEVLDIEYNFEMFKNNLRENISEEELAEAERLFNEATNANKESQKLWQELYAMDIFNVEKSLNSSNTSNIKLSQLDTINIEDFDLEKIYEKIIIEECTVGMSDLKSISIKSAEIEDDASLSTIAINKEMEFDIEDFDLDKLYEKIIIEECTVGMSDSESVSINLAEIKDEAALSTITINKVEGVEDQFTCSLIGFESYKYTFDMFKEGLKDDISEEDLTKAEKLFTKATELSQKSNELWNELYAMDIYNYEKNGNFSCGFDGDALIIEKYKPEN